VPDARIAAQITRALGDARRVVNVGAGTGAYEPRDRAVVAVEPATTMITQRAPGAAPVVQGVAGTLPFAAGVFDAALCSLTIHHWPDWRAGLREVRRATRGRVVVFHFDVGDQGTFWLTREYLPEALSLPAPSVAEVVDALGRAHVETVPVPADCTDGFFCAYWCRPEVYLDPTVRAAISTFHLLDADVCDRAITALARDLASGAWDRRHGHLRDLAEADLGYRLIIDR
jgi:SAM-dependent methyltransferase